MSTAIPEVVDTHLVSGDYDHYIRIAVRDTRGYERPLREKPYKIPGGRHGRSHFVLCVLEERTSQ
jgi:Lrp/AsnC family leucine-responsive transcriptional regulator